VRREWGNADYWAWWWRNQVSADAKIVAAVVAIGLLGIGGYVAANGLEGSVGGAEAGGAEIEVVTTTVQRLVTVRAGGAASADSAGGAAAPRSAGAAGAAGPTQTVVRQVQVAGPAARAGRVTDRLTQVQVKTVAGEAGTRVVTQRQVVPVVRREVVTVAGDVRTVVQQAPGGTETRTVDRVVERVVERAVDRVVTQERIVTVVQSRTVTETVMVTVNTPVTVTAGPITVTVTLPLPPLIPTLP
jgi:hypothetical protein